MIADDLTSAQATRQSGGAGFQPGSEDERESVRLHLARILASSAFQNSKRYSAVLKYLVEQTLEGQGARLKERTIGIDVFQRPPDYDTGSDHAVRSAVAEVRKRLAQYYQMNAADPLRIELSPGSYTPQFRKIEEHIPLPPVAKALPEKELPIEALPAPEAAAAPHRWLWPAIAAVVALAAVLAFFAAHVRGNDPLDLFWKPVLSARGPALLCVGDVEGGRGETGGAANLPATATIDQFHVSPAETMLVQDAITVAKVAALMQAKSKRFQLASQSDATFSDLQNGPTILVGLMNNGWTERLVPQLRYSVRHQGPSRVLIYDRNNPSNNDWSVDYSTPYMSLTRDYALVLRMVDPETEQVVVVAAGITAFGTLAAGDFVTNPSEMKKLLAVAPKGWENKNVEIVLSTEVIRGRPGPANVVAAQFW